MLSKAVVAFACVAVALGKISALDKNIFAYMLN